MMLKYFSAFLVMLFLGNIADVPIMFLGVRGELSLYFVFIASFCTDIFSDLFWYWLGGKIGLSRFERIWFFKGKEEKIETVGKALNRYGFVILFLSKFITTLGVPSQIVAGAHKYPIKKLLLANIVGAASLLLVVYNLARIFASDTVAEKFLKNADLALVLFVSFIVLLHYLISKPINKLLLSRNGVKDGVESNAGSHGNI
ncbi:MAG: VTT domain-containing protein [Candidatus Paceibacterota bacterium]